MREQNVIRQSTHVVKTKDRSYLHLKFLVEDIRSACERYARGRLIDIGCGNKPYKELMPEVSEYVGCDFVQSNLQCVDVLCEANAIPLPSESFDTAFSTQTIEHVADHAGLVREAYRLLRPGGYFIVSGPMYWPLHEVPHDYFRFTRYGFQSLLENAGFTDIEVRANGGQWALCGQVLIHTLQPRRGIRILLNKLFAWLDVRYRNESNTMNYVLVGHKR